VLLRILLACAFRAGAYVVMMALSVWNELRPAPSLPDLVVSLVPYVPWVHHVNYWVWLLLYVPLSLTLLWRAPERWCRYMITGGLVSIARGVCIALTGLGPPDPAHAGPGTAGHGYWDVLFALLSPIDIFGRNSAHLYMTKDLFFSGHTASTFLLLLYLWPWPRLRALAAFAHVCAVASVMLAHLHYAIDIAGAYAFAFAIFALREWRPRPGVSSSSR
jgi:hypothetical protein